jgi:hypothetical protein
MRKAEALRLKPGQRVFCTNATKFQHATQYWVGEVVHVTPKGGVLMKVIEGKIPGGSMDWCGPGTGPDAGKQKWFQYNHVQRA